VVPTIRFRERLFIEPGLRLDGGSVSGSSSRINLFPKTNVSWLAVNRQGTTPLFGVLTSLRPRIAFGIAGVQPGPTMQLRLSSTGGFVPIGPTGPGIPLPISSIITLGNTEIHPERSREVEGGADLNFWEDRLDLTVTLHHKLTRDAIQALPVAPSVLPDGSGFGSLASYYANIGDVRNTGLELQGTLRVLDARAVQWSMTGSFAQNQNTLVRSALGGQVYGGIGYGGVTTRLVPGYPIDGLWAKPILNYHDDNGDGLIESNEVLVGDKLVYLGSQQPRSETTLSTALSLWNNRVTINTAVDYQQGMTQFLSGGAGCGDAVRSDGVGYGCLALNNPTLPVSEVAAIAVSDRTGIGLAQTVSVLRWQSISVSYLVPPNVSRRLRVPYMSVALQGSNLALHTNYRGKDPNVSARATGNSTDDTGQLPLPRLWSLNVRIGN
jgi:hypothetical protein